ncbi:hypothetical protein BH18PSE1_BH18PSE1_03510 [soil metagenome]
MAACPQAGVIKSGKTTPMDNNHQEVLDISSPYHRILQADVTHFINQPMLTHILAGVNEGLHRT